MKEIFRGRALTCLGVLAIGLLVLAHAPAASSGRKDASGETYDQGREVPLIKGLIFKVTDAYWTDQISMPGIPEQAQSERTRARASNAFLVVGVSVANPTKDAVRFGGFNVAPMVFRLMNDQDQNFAPSEIPFLANDSFTTKMWMGSDINPGAALKGNVVFDVPKGNYVLATCNSKMSGGDFVPVAIEFRNRLSPTDKSVLGAGEPTQAAAAKTPSIIDLEALYPELAAKLKAIQVQRRGQNQGGSQPEYVLSQEEYGRFREAAAKASIAKCTPQCSAAESSQGTSCLDGSCWSYCLGSDSILRARSTATICGP